MSFPGGSLLQQTLSVCVCVGSYGRLTALFCLSLPRPFPPSPSTFDPRPTTLPPPPPLCARARAYVCAVMLYAETGVE